MNAPCMHPVYNKFTQFMYFQNDLDEVTRVWNSHRIGHYRNMACPSGKPILLYHSPEAYGGEDCLKPVPRNAIEACANAATKNKFPCEESLYKLCCIIMSERGYSAPKSDREGNELYRRLREEILRDIQNIY